jgi:RecJ-like exonuclease
MTRQSTYHPTPEQAERIRAYLESLKSKPGYTVTIDDNPDVCERCDEPMIWEQCPDCRGDGRIDMGTICPTCDGECGWYNHRCADVLEAK